MPIDLYDVDMRKVPNLFWERDTQIFALRKKHQSYAQISKTFNISRERVRQILLRKPVKVYLREDIGSKFTGREHTRELVRVRDKHTCQKCFRVWEKEERRFDVHHLKGLCGKKSRTYDRVGDMDKLITYCHKCHMGLHTVRVKNTKAWKQRRQLKDSKLLELRNAFILQAYKQGFPQGDIGTLFSVKQATISHVIKKYA